MTELWTNQYLGSSCRHLLHSDRNEAREVTRQVNPKIAIPMHFWWEQAVQEYTQGLERVKMLTTPALKISKPELPQPIQT
jgi:L-ascorbate metabolism protein UlaG (beta-lactamase superfamily)